MTAGDLDEQTVLAGWDDRFSVVRALITRGDHAAAVIDSNGDGADINLEHFRRTAGGSWECLSSSGGAGVWGNSWADGMWARHDWNEDDGWTLTLEPGDFPPDAFLPM